MTSKRIWIVSELYYPEETSTGHFMTKVAEGLGREFTVKVLCAQPSYSKRGLRAPRREIHNQVDIIRCISTTFNKDNLFLKTVNIITISLSIFFNALIYLKCDDFVLVVTNPPLLPYITMMACRLRGARCLVRVDDVYPDVMLATGMLDKHGAAYRVIDWMTKQLYQKSERIITIGRDMHELASNKMSRHHERVQVITNWADCDFIAPTPKKTNALLCEFGLSDKFVVQWAGNMGRPHEVKSLLEAMIRLKNHPDVHFLFIGSGSKRAWLEAEAKKTGIENATFLGDRPRGDQRNFLNACDIALSSLVEGMAGISVPSRMYNILASGKPILAIGDPASELAMVITEEGAGWVVAPGRPDEIVRIILMARETPILLSEMGKRGRAAAETKYSSRFVIGQYIDLFHGLGAMAQVR